jgi:hypothetical protein
MTVVGQAGDAVDTALSEGETSRATSERARQARILLDQAGEAQEVRDWIGNIEMN